MLKDRLEQFAQGYKGRIVLTSRSARYGGRIMSGATEVEILAFRPHEIDAFVATWFENDNSRLTQLAEELQKHHQIGGLARIPLLLALICRIFEEPNAKLPVRRAELYKRALTGLMFDWLRDDRKALSLDDWDRENYLDQLGEAAWKLQLREQFSDKTLASAWGLENKKKKATGGSTGSSAWAYW